MNRAVLAVFAVHVLVLYTPLSTAFRVGPLGWADWAVVVVAAALGGLVAELLKLPALAREQAAREASTSGSRPSPTG